MWFVWDGKARQGPFSETEICRRLAMGQWSLSVWVRPEKQLVYRPICWMLPDWSKPDFDHLDATAIRAFDSIIHQETSVAALESFEFVSRSMDENLFETPAASSSNEPTIPLQEMNRKAEKTVEQKNEDNDLFREAIEEKVQKIRAELRLEPESQEGGVREGERKPQKSKNPVEPPQKSSPLAGSSAPELPTGLQFGESPKSDSQPLKSKLAKKSRFGNQKPAMRSEGSVSLVDNDSGTQIRLRRVNPTAPRRNSKKSRTPAYLMVFTKKWWASLDTVSLIAIALSVAATLSLLTIAFLSYGRKLGKSSIVQESSSNFFQETPQAGENTPPEISPPRKKKKKRLKENVEAAGIPSEGAGDTNQSQAPIAVTQPKESNDRLSEGTKYSSSSKTKSSEKKLAARQPLREPPAKKFTPPPTRAESGYFSNSKQIDKYLASTPQSLRTFVVIGPLVVSEIPGSGCGPCVAKGKLPDGSQVILSSYEPAPWSTVRGARSFYAKGFVNRETVATYRLFVNSLSRAPQK